MRKIFGRQLELGAHPAAQPLLPRPVTAARALVKGWLFYPAGSWPAMSGITAGHCRGFWCALGELDSLGADAFLVLPKLQWLAPFRAGQAASMLNRAQLHAELEAQFETNPSPVLVAVVRADAGAGGRSGARLHRPGRLARACRGAQRSRQYAKYCLVKLQFMQILFA